MDDASPSKDAEARIAALERGMRRLAGACLLLFVLAAGSLAWHFVPAEELPSAPGTVRAREFRLVSADGRTRGVLGLTAEDGDAELRLDGRDGGIRLGIDARGAPTFEASSGPGRLELTFAGSGERAAPHLYLSGAGAAALDLEPSFARFAGGGGTVLIDANDGETNGVSVRQGEVVRFRTPR